MRDYVKGFTAEMSGFVLGFISLQQINQVLELILLSCGVVSTVYGLYKFLKAKK